MTADLITWLRAQLDEDERVAREALKRQTSQRRMIRGQMVDVPNQPMPEWRRSVWPPGRVLAEVEAKRRVLDLADDATGLDMSVDMDRRVGVRDTAVEPYLGDQIALVLAQPYAGRDGWREEWAVSGRLA